MSQHNATPPVSPGRQTGYVIRLLRAGFLLVCVTAALAYLSPGVLRSHSPSQAPDGAPSSLGSLLPFDAPVWSAAVFKAGMSEGGQAVARVTRPTEEVVVVNDWNYTAIVRGRPQPSTHK
jgi:hypothetical protein